MLWSTLINSSRHVVGNETVWSTAGNPLFVEFAAGISASSAWPTAVIGTAAGLGTLGQSTPGHKSEKFPDRSASEGTFCRIVDGFFSLRHSCDQKKKVFFLSLLK